MGGSLTPRAAGVPPQPGGPLGGVQQMPPPPAGAASPAIDALLAGVQALTNAQAMVMTRLQSEPSTHDPLKHLAGSGGGDILSLPGARGAAALELYRRDFLSKPEVYTKTVRENAAVALDMHVDAPPANLFVSFLTRYMAWGRASKATVHLAYGMGHCLDQMAAGRWSHAEATLATLLAGLEQSLLDEGRWTVGWLLTHLPDPPWHLLSTSPATAQGRPFGRLAPPSWTAAASAYVRDAAALEELRRRGMRTGGGEDGERVGEFGESARSAADKRKAAAKAKAAAAAAAAAGGGR